MCGVVGYIGEQNCVEKSIKMLEKLEYRGYDSAGISFFEKGEIKTIKSVGKIEVLKSKIPNTIETNCIIGHTRWATHGKPCDKNSHPHNSSDGKWSVVHNGIIENYNQLKIQNNILNLHSETDTEVFAKLLEKNNNVEPIKNIIECCEKIKGSFAFAVLNKDYKNTMFLAKRNSPLFVAHNGKECFVASDPIAFVGNTESYYLISNNEFCVATENNVVFYNKKCQKIEKKQIKLEINKSEAELNGYLHFMLKEIKETSQVLKNIVNLYEQHNIFDKLKLIHFNKIKIIGCGTAYHSGLIGAEYLKEACKRDVEVCLASEFRYANNFINSKTLCIFVSQSGETADTIGAVDVAIKHKCKTLAITNVLHSTIASKVNFVLPIYAGPEIAVASTKAYVAQCFVFYLLAHYIKLLKNNNLINYSNLRKIVKIITKYIEKTINIYENNYKEIITNKINNSKNVFFVGRSWDYFTCLEASLKLKEIAYINCWAIAGGELKHGTLALIEKGVLVVVVLTDKKIADKTINAIQQIKARGSNILLISTIINAKQYLDDEDIFFLLNENCDKKFLPMLSVVPLQLCAYYVSCSKGYNPDKPRNLAKSVTVE